jgi:hypothetical protein
MITNQKLEHLLLNNQEKQEFYKEMTWRFKKYISDFDSANINDSLLVKKNGNITTYQKSMLDLVAIDCIFTTKGSDNSNIYPDKPYFIFKNRGYRSKTGYIIPGINSEYFKRHWYLYYNKPRDISWDEKQGKLFWRGAFTGNIHRPGSRYKLLINNFEKSSLIDIGLTKSLGIPDEKRQYIDNKWLTKKVEPEKFLEYKYILSVHGNDKDSGLNWKLNSNSVVLMNKPEYTSWLLECELKPWVHYVPLNSDFTDLFDKIVWCEANQHKCKEIVQNANNFMKMFSDIKFEEKLERMVINHYKNSMRKYGYIS